MTDPLITAVNRIAHRPDHRVGPLARRLAADATLRDRYVAELRAAMESWRSGIAAVEGGSKRGLQIERLLRPYTTVLDTLLTDKVLASALAVSTSDFLARPAPTKADIEARWTQRRRDDVSDLPFECRLSAFLDEHVVEVVGDLRRDHDWTRLVAVEDDLLAMRHHLKTPPLTFAVPSKSTPGKVSDLLVAHLGSGSTTAALHMVAQLSLIRRMPTSADRTPDELRERARHSQQLPRKYASLHLGHLNVAAVATSQLGRSPGLARHQGFELDPRHFVDGVKGVRPAQRLADVEFHDGAEMTKVSQKPARGPHLQCPAVHSRVESDGRALIGLDALWSFTVDAYAGAGLFDAGERARLNGELGYLNTGQHSYRAMIPYSVPETGRSRGLT